MSFYCRRCEGTVEATYPHPRLRRLVIGYFLLGIPFIPFLPIIGADFVVMLPLTMLYLLGMGAALRVLRERPLCDTCGAEIDRPPSWRDRWRARRLAAAPATPAPDPKDMPRETGSEPPPAGP